MPVSGPNRGRFTAPLEIGQTITMEFTIEGSGQFVPTEGTTSARVRLFLQEQGDTLIPQPSSISGGGVQLSLG